MKALKRYLSPIITIIILGLFTLYLYRNPEIINELLSTSPIYILLIMIVYLSIFYIEGIFILITLQIFDRKISQIESFFLATISRIGNYLLPMRAGALFRATYLKKKYNFRYANFLSTLYGYYIIFFLTNSLLAIFVLLGKSIGTQNISYPLLLFFIFIVIGMLLLIFLRFPFKKFLRGKIKFVEKIVSILDQFIDGWDLIVKNKRAFLMLILVAFGNIFLNMIVVYVEFSAIQKIPSILDIILYTCISGVSLLISITPGSLGIREGAFLLTSESIGLSPDEIMRLAFLDRGVMFVLLLLCLLVIMIFFRKISLKDIFFGKEKSK